MQIRPYILFSAAIIVWLLIVVAALLGRTIIPIDETRYLSVAWEMWLNHDFLVPHLNGIPYSHKPPLLFWLINAGWWLFGVNEVWPRVLSALFELGSMLLAMFIARKLWPGRSESMYYASLILMTMLLWVVYTSAVVFDFLVVFFVLCAAVGVIRIWQTNASFAGWLLVGLAIGLGMLAKGPVVLVYTLPLVLLAPWWLEYKPESWVKWYVGLFLAVMLGAGIVLSWALPAASAGGEQYAEQILWSQTSGRIAHSFAHERPFWWYIGFVPLLFFPWIVWPGLWRAQVSMYRGSLDASVRFALCMCLPQFILLSLISGKQVHYLLPLCPPLALLFAHSLATQKYNRPMHHLVFPALVIAALAVIAEMLAWPKTLQLPYQWYSGVSPVWGVSLFVLAFVTCRIKWHSLNRFMIALPTSMVATGLVLFQLVIPSLSPALNLHKISHYIAAFQNKGVPVAQLGRYDGQYQFLGRLRKPLLTLKDKNDVFTWARQHPQGMVITYYYKQKPDFERLKPDYVQPYRTGYAAIWQGKRLLSMPEILLAAYSS